MNNLIKKLEAATEGSEELDLEVMKKLFPEQEITKVGDWLYAHPPVKVRWEHYTQSLDATENALPKGWEWTNMAKEGEWGAYATRVSDKEWVVALHQSLPIARTIAVLKAHQEVRDEQ